MTPNGHGADGAQDAPRLTPRSLHGRADEPTHRAHHASTTFRFGLTHTTPEEPAGCASGGQWRAATDHPLLRRTKLIVEACSDGLLTRVESAIRSATQDTSQQPTRRQLEYLAFISKYIHRFGRAPAERDIERHFLVSAPTVNQMMQMLERRGFITRQPGVPRSIRICIDLTAPGS